MIVYYVVGRPRSGSTFVGDWIARELDVLNAGEVWQTLRTLNALGPDALKEETGRWTQPEARAAKELEIRANPFWSRVMERAPVSDNDNPYAALVETVKERWSAFVDCSKTDEGIERYQELGCDVVVIHSVRAYSTWVRSVMRYQDEYSLTPHSRLRLLVSYIRNNRRLARYARTHRYYSIRQEQLSDAESHLPRASSNCDIGGGYERHEMFGTPDFSTSYSKKRAAPKVTLFDQVLYALIEAR